MLAIINKFNDDEVTPMMLDDDAWFVTHAFNGNDELQFTFSEESGYYDLLEEESKVLAIGLRGRSNRFVVKNIDSHDGIVTVNCDVDLYDWQKTIFDTYGGGSARTLEKVLQDVTPSGWSYSGQEQFGKSEVFQSGSREPVKAGTPLDVLDLACEVYGCVFNFDNIANHLYVIDPESYTPSGDFLSDEVNLKSLGYVGNSEGYATRLYPYGKRDEDGNNPVTIESVNGGLPYVTNNEFSDDVICVGWSDERYTDPEHLKEAAILRLAELAVPTRSYECDVSQLNRNVWLYMVLTMIDRKHRTRVDQQVVEWKEYGRPDLDIVTLSAVAPSLESLLKSAETDDDAIYQYVNGVANDLTNAYEEAIENATDKITGNDGGYFQWIFDAEGRPVELVNLGDSMDINSAQKVWRWNKSGLGHSNNGYNGQYDLALLDDGSINASMITTGILNAVVIKAGVISDVLGRNFWNMETGEFSLSAAATVGGDTVGTIASNAASDAQKAAVEAAEKADAKRLEEAKKYAANQASSAGTDAKDQAKKYVEALDEALGQKSIFDRLTNNGQAQGIYLKDGKVYINGTYIDTGVLDADLLKAGIITDKAGKNFWDLTTGEFSLSASATVGGSEAGGSVVAVDVQYGNSTSSSTQPTTWTTYANWKQGQYLWTRLKLTLADGTTEYTSARRMADTDGIGVSRVREQYYLSTSSSTQTGGSWQYAQPTWVSGRYYWTRSEITWSDGTKTYTTAVLARALTSGNQSTDDLDDDLDQREVFNRLTNNGQTQGIYLSGGLLYVNATYLETGVISDRLARNTWNLNTGALTTNYMTANNIDASGTFECGYDSNLLRLINGEIRGLENGTQIGKIDFSAHSHNVQDPSITYRGIQITSEGTVRISSPQISTAASSDQSTTATIAHTGNHTFHYVSEIHDNGNGTVGWTNSWRSLNFINGLCTTCGFN